MEASGSLTETPAPEAEVTETSPAEARHPQELYKYSEWVHVGPGAEECENGMDGECNNSLHFHAWCRLPNQFQHQSIREKAMAAKARRVRLYRDPESDASLIIDNQFEEIEATMGEDAARSTYIEEIVFKDYMKDFFEVAQEMNDEEGEEDDEPPWATIHEDRERLRVLGQMDPDDRPNEEFAELQSHVKEYEETIEARVKERQDPVRESLQGRSLDELRGMVREQRIQKDANTVYMQTYTLWEQYIGTMRRQVPKEVEAVHERVFKNVEHLRAAAPEVVNALDTTFTNLDGEFGKTLAPEMAGKDS